MNHKMIRFMLYWMIRLEGAFMAPACLIAFLYGEKRQGLVYLVFAAVLFAAGTLAVKNRPDRLDIYQRDGMVIVALGWLEFCVIGALPFVICGEIPSFINALFETISGFTTTGASILTEVEVLSHASLFWRSFTHWIGGMGVLVFLLMLMPVQDGSHMNLMKAESPGPDVSKFVPRVRQTAILLYKIYIAMTVIEIVVLLISGMHWFDSLCISFGTAGTGGFTILNSGMATYTPLQHWIVGIFMVLFGVNFSFYYLMLCKKGAEALRMDEVRAYFVSIIGATLLIAVNIRDQFVSAEEVFRHAFFQVGSIMTTTGYATADFNIWPAFSKVILILLMFVGACAGSTGGGIKVSRIVMLAKAVKREFHQMLHPRSIGKVRMNGQTVSDDLIRTVLMYLSTYLVIFTVSLLLVSINGYSFETDFSAVAATLNNIGPGLDLVGPMSNYGFFSPFTKIILAFDMLAGRLELFPMMILFLPGTWRRRE